jgi:O-succinylbenzoic acid--CoA ligase
MSAPADWPTRDILSHRAETTPDRTAVVDADSGMAWTYRGFDGLVDGVARRLQESLDGTDRVRVGTLVSTRVAFVTTFHACLRVGVTVAPLNVRLAEPELGDRLARIEPDVLVCERDTEERAAHAADCRVRSLDEPGSASVGHLAWDEDGTESVEPARQERSDTAVLLFTSGTTGEPKCVRLTLGNLVASATASAFRLGVAPGDRWLDCLPVYHMGGLAPLVRCPLYGTALLVQRGFDTDATAEAAATHRATGVSLVPTQLRRLLEAGWEPPDALGTVLLGGAPAPARLVSRALDRDVPVHPTYGLTEAASQVTTASPEHVREAPESVGPPLVVAAVTLVDGGEPVPAGEAGEVVVDGPTVSPGYLDPDRTAEAFGEHGLHTGDIGYRDDDGHLRILGRIDGAILTGGENVHPAEVEAVLRDHPGVADAAVVGLPDEEWGQRVGALVAAEERGLTPADLKAFARDRLAGYKIPRTVTVGPALPRTASGTVDRGAVRDRLTAE